MTKPKLRKLKEKVVKLRGCILHFSQIYFPMCYCEYSSLIMIQEKITDATKILVAQIKSHDVSKKMFRDQITLPSPCYNYQFIKTENHLC